MIGYGLWQCQRRFRWVVVDTDEDGNAKFEIDNEKWEMGRRRGAWAVGPLTAGGDGPTPDGNGRGWTASVWDGEGAFARFQVGL